MMSSMSTLRASSWYNSEAAPFVRLSITRLPLEQSASVLYFQSQHDMCFICLYSAARQLLARWWRRTGSLPGAAALLSTCEPLPCMPISSYGFCMYCSISSQEGPFARCIEVAGWIALENCVLRCGVLQVVRERCDGHPLHCGLQRLQGRGQQPHQAGQHTPFSSSLPTTLLYLASLSAHCFACASCAVFKNSALPKYRYL